MPRNFVGLDYHLDWLVAALTCAAEGKWRGIRRNDEDLVHGSQEDVDLLVAFQKDELAHIIMIEAKGVLNGILIKWHGRFGVRLRSSDATGARGPTYDHT